MLAPGKKSYDKPTLPTKICIVKAMVFQIVKYECESWAIKKAELWKFDAFELWCWRRLLRVPWTARKSNQSILKEPWIFTGRTDAETPILWPPDANSWLIGKDTDAGKDWRWEKGTTEDEMVGWHHWLNGHLSTTLGNWAQFKQNSGRQLKRGKPGVLQSMGL